MTYTISTPDENTREYTVNIDYGPYLGEEFTLRIGQMSAVLATPFIPAPYYVSIETAEQPLYKKLQSVLKIDFPDNRLQQISYRLSPDKNTYISEFELKASSKALPALESFVQDILDKMSKANLLSTLDAFEIIKNDRDFFPPSSRDIVLG